MKMFTRECVTGTLETQTPIEQHPGSYFKTRLCTRLASPSLHLPCWGTRGCREQNLGPLQMAFVHNVLARVPGTEVVTTFSLARKLEANTKETTPRFPQLAQPWPAWPGLLVLPSAPEKHLLSSWKAGDPTRLEFLGRNDGVTQINKQTLRALAQQQRMCAETDGILVKMEHCAESGHTSEEPHTTEAGSGHLSQLPARTSFLLSLVLPSSTSKSE